MEGGKAIGFARFTKKLKYFCKILKINIQVISFNSIFSACPGNFFIQNEPA